MGEYKKAVLELEKAVGLVPNDPIINDHLGMLCGGQVINMKQFINGREL